MVATFQHFFASQVNFLDPQTRDGKPYGPIRYKEIVNECVIISKNLNTSYKDILQVTPIERKYMLEYLLREADQVKKRIEEAKEKNRSKRTTYKPPRSTKFYR